MKSFPLFAATIICLLVQLSAHAEVLRVSTARGLQLDVIADFPPGAGPFPAIVLASGQGYHMGLPALEQTARNLVENGVAVYRFNWAYFTSDPKGGQPSPGYSNELGDLQTVIKVARAEKRVAQSKLAVGGKSLGSMVAWRAFTQDKTLRAGLFLTPVCSKTEQGQTVSIAEENYPGFAADFRPVAFVSGDQDPLCAPSILYRFASVANTKARVAIVGGDHGFNHPTLVGSGRDAARTRSISSVATFSTGFILDGLLD